MKQFWIGLIIGGVLAGTAYPLVAGFTLRGSRISIGSGSRSLTSDELAQAVLANQDEINALRGEINRMRQDNQSLRKDVDDLERQITQFKNLYFRQF